MAHGTLVGGTAYGISGGKTLVDGTSYSIDIGKTLINGAAYDIEFVSLITVTITGSLGTYSYVSIDGVEYRENTVVETTAGLGMTVRADVMKAEYSEDCYIYLNGEQVERGSGTAGAVWHTTVPDCSSITINFVTEGSGKVAYITTE